MERIEIKECKDGLIIPHTGVCLTYACNLRCKLCCTGSPYMQE